MKLGTSHCFAVSLFLTLNQVSSAQTQGQGAQSRPPKFTAEYTSQAQNQPGQSNNGQPSPVWENLFVSGVAPALLSHDPGSGMSLAPADDVLRDHLRLPKGQGLVVTALDGNSPEARAGIQLNDVLLKLGETSLAKPEDLDESVKRARAGEQPLLLFVFRGGRQLKFYVQPQIRVTLGPAEPKPAQQEYWIGVSVSAIEPVLRSQLEIPTNSGLIVNEVVSNSPAEKAGVKVHDILLDLSGNPVSDPHKLAEFVQAHGEKPIVVRILRAGWTKNGRNVEVTPEQRKSTALPTRANPSASWYFVRPGAVLPQTIHAQENRADLLYNLVNDTLTVTQPDAINRKPAEDANAAVSKRLDALDAEIKQLRKAVEAIGKAEKTIEELNKAAAALNKAIKDSK